MISFLHRLFRARTEAVAMRASITPGRLYAIMSADFKSAASKHCSRCVMPLPYTCSRDMPDDCNWRIQMSIWKCDECSRLASRIAKKYAAIYDLRDPFWTGAASAAWISDEQQQAQIG